MKCRASSYVQWVEVIISGTEHNMKLKFSMLTYLTQSYKHYSGRLPCSSDHRSMMSMFLYLEVGNVYRLLLKNKIATMLFLKKTFPNLFYSF